MEHTIESVVKDIKKGKFFPVYFIYGDEPFGIDEVADELVRRVVPESEKGLAQFILYGKDTDVTTVLSHARSFPFMADRQLVIVKEAQGLIGIDRKEEQKRIEDYVNSPLASTVLAFCFHGNTDERRSFVRAFNKFGVVLNSKKIYDSKLPEWVAAYCHQNNVKVSPKAIQMLVDNIGNDLKRLRNEIQKILISLKPGEAVDAGAVERFVGISKEYNVFELQKAIVQRDVMKANQIAQFFAANTKDNPLIPMLIILYNFFTKVLIVHQQSDKSEKGLASVLSVNVFFAKDYALAARNYPEWKVVHIIKLLRETDVRLKGVEGENITEAALLKELLFKMMH